MTVGDLIDRLLEYDPDQDIMILDSFNGSGYPRDLNLGPTSRTITDQDARFAADCEGRAGEEIVIIGFGSY